MTACKITALADRTVIEISGADAGTFLQGLITNDIEQARDGAAIHAALLTPQGKILFDFLVVARDEGYLLDCRREIAAELIKRLTFYRLRANVEITDRSDAMSVYAIWGDEPSEIKEGILYGDPRVAALGHRLIALSAKNALAAWCNEAPAEIYHAHRIALGVPEGGLDYPFSDTFPHEADYDQLGGVDFAKGCFVGQEVVSRMEHRGTARKRIVPVTGAAALTSGAEITANGSTIGSVASVAGDKALALIRLDRADKALEAGNALQADGVALTLVQPAWATFTVPGAKGDGP